MLQLITTSNYYYLLICLIMKFEKAGNKCARPRLALILVHRHGVFQVISESVRHVTRFIGLASVGNPEKQKWIYAFNIVPIESMDRSELVMQPANVTEMPFKESHLKLVSVIKTISTPSTL